MYNLSWSLQRPFDSMDSNIVPALVSASAPCWPANAAMAVATGLGVARCPICFEVVVGGRRHCLVSALELDNVMATKAIHDPGFIAEMVSLDKPNSIAMVAAFDSLDRWHG